MSKEHFSDDDLARFKQAQRLTYDAVTHVEKELYEGITEKEAAAKIERWLRDHGVTNFFHYGFAWFGERAAFRGFVRLADNAILTNLLPHFGKQFQPSNRKLRKGDSVILDVAPAIGDIAVDMGYACSLGESEGLHAARMALEPLRELILSMVKAGKTQRDIYAAVDRRIAEQGYEAAHSVYPNAVLGHKIGKYPMPMLKLPRVLGFGPQALLYLGNHIAHAALPTKANAMPLWNMHSNVPCEPGLWAVEPHIAKGNVGAKWEELLVVTEDTAYWLDDDLAHHRYWKEHRSANSVHTATA
jgi:Xaa-Pro aminopeptidase